MIPVRYIVRSLVGRRGSTIAVVLGTALVVVVFAAALMIPSGIEKVTKQSQHPDIAIVMSAGASTETESFLLEEAARSAIAAKEITRGEDGQPLAVAEVIVLALMEKSGTSSKGKGAEVLVRVRGITERSLLIRPEVKVVAGRLPKLGTDEAMVGKALHGHFKSLDLGKQFELKRGKPTTIVGVFTSDGGLDESEVFADAAAVRIAMGREGTFSSVRAKVPPDAFASFASYVEGDKRYGAQVRRETEFVNAQYGPQRIMMQALGFSVSFFFGLGGIIGALVTMHSAVANRSREIGTLRALGFSRTVVLTCIVIETMCLTFVGGIIGSALSLAVGQIEISVINMLTLSEVVFKLNATPQLIAIAMGFALLLGLFGGFLPALSASRMRPIDALRA